MQNCWTWVANFWNQAIPKENLITITFSNYPKVVVDNILLTDIGKHGGGGTDIVPAFVKME